MILLNMLGRVLPSIFYLNFLNFVLFKTCLRNEKLFIEKNEEKKTKINIYL